jgi:PAS domain S-box-containing protein
MWIFDMETLAFLEVNDAAVSHYGYSREEFLQMTTKEIRPPEEIPALLANVANRSDGYDFTGTFLHRKKDGTVFHTEISRYAFMQNGRRVRLVIANDVTQRKRAEEELRASEQRYRALFEHNLAAVFRTSTNGKLLDFNDAMCRVLGYSREELYQMNLRTLYCDPSVRDAGLKQLLKHRKLLNYQAQLRRKDGSTATILADLNLLREEPNKPAIVAGTMLDVTETRKLQEQLLQAQKLEAIGKLTGGIAHDFNNILMIINSYSEMVLDQIDGQSPLRRPVEQIRRAGDRAMSLTRQLLAFSRKQVMTPVVLNLASALSDVKEMLKRLIGEDVALEVSSTEDLWSIKADPSQIQQVVFNLAVNARDAMPNGGKLILRTANVVLQDDFVRANPGSKAGKYVLFIVSDTGCGITPEIKARIFEPFFTTKEAGKGTGLGLSTVYGIVKQSGGYITVESEPGKGTSFCLYFPCAQSSQPERKEEPVEIAVAPRATVLLVEDEDPTREAIADYLGQNGFRVVALANAEEALRRCETADADPIDLLLTDVVMPGMNGVDLARRFCAQHPQVRVVFMSGYTDDVLVRSGISESQITLLSKPFRLPDLAGKLKGILAASVAKA